MSDSIVPLGDGSSSLRLKDMGDSTVARVIFSGSSSASSAGDKLLEIGDGGSKKRMRDMGDSSVAEVFHGA